VERIAAPVLWAGLGIVAGLVALPWLLSGYFIGIASEVLIFAIFAVAVHMCLAVAGIVTFGHAAYLALGGYGAAIASTQYGVPFAGALAWGVGLAMAGGALISLVMARVHGVYLAMLTLAMAQIVYALSKQFVGLTGGDDGVLGVWPPAFLDQTARYYWCVLALAVGVCVGVQWAVRHPVGQRMRAARDDAVRYAALGGCAACQRALWFIASCALAGLAGGLLAFQKGSLFPDIASVANSVDGLVMVMLGGVSSLLGPWIGAIGYKVFETQIMSATDMWRLLLGGGILLLALWQPQGIAAVWRHQQKRWRFSPIKRVHKGRDHDD
jgi:branched-chain amino acid transport system permease protein